MSSKSDRDPLEGQIKQDQKVVGGICLPEENTGAFIEEFNLCYGPINLQIAAPDFVVMPEHPLLPVGATKPKPFFYGPNPSSGKPNS
ncbi:MAG: hypothetical protein AB8B50_05970 [Pirellulaceae bacterium]